MSTFVLVSEKSWHRKLYKDLRQKQPHAAWHLVDKKEDFTPERLRQIGPEKIFIPHWSYIIPGEIYNNFECVLFHMTDLPYGRGGSPLQNLILNGHTKTKISAIRVSKGLDTGDVYMKRSLSLSGTARQIFERSTAVIFRMILKITENKYVLKPQEGTPVVFKRRTPEMSDLKDLGTLREIYDYIRMLDGEGYPPAFLETEHFKFEFTKAKYQETEINAHVRIIKK